MIGGHKRAREHATGTVLVLAAIVVVGVPFWLLIVNSFKPYAETTTPNLGLPTTWHVVENYTTVLGTASVAKGFANTAVLLLATIPPTLWLSAAGAWIFARAKARLLTPLYYAMLIGVVVPPALVASIFVLKGLGIYGGLPGLAILYCAWYVPLGIFLITGFVKTIPMELEEAARIDGAGSVVVFTRIVLPLLSPILISTGLIVAISMWNDFLTPFMMLRDPENRTLMLSVYDFATGSTVGSTYQWNLVFADIVITSLPLVAIYYFAQRWIVYGLSGVGR